MVQATRAAMACKSVLLRDIIKESLEEKGIEFLHVGACFSDFPTDRNPDVAILIETVPGEMTAGDENLRVLANRFSRWLIIGPSGIGSTFQRMRAIRNDVSGVPLDIGKSDMYHAVNLAARFDTVCVGESHLQEPSPELIRLNEARLDEGQWKMLEMLASGASNKHIAIQFACEEAKVKGMMRRLLSAISANNRTQAAVMAARAGL